MHLVHEPGELALGIALGAVNGDDADLSLAVWAARYSNLIRHDRAPRRVMLPLTALGPSGCGPGRLRRPHGGNVLSIASQLNGCHLAVPRATLRPVDIKLATASRHATP